MDDPWGSPWASAASDATQKHDPPPSPTPPKSLLSLPPKAFFGGVTNSPAQSPWADHGFGEWTASDQAEDTAATAPWGLWPESGLTPRAESPGKQSPIAWPSSTATSPGLKPTLRSRSSSVFRQASPDPWAAEAHWLDRNETLSPLPQSHARDGIENGIPAGTGVVIHIEEPKAGAGENTDNRDGIGVKKSTGDIESAIVRDSPSFAVSLTAEAEGHESPSRPSSTFSTESSHGLDRQDSPITSIDEDATFRPRSSTRKTSTKVSELVGLYDGLAQAASEEPSIPDRPDGRTGSRARSADRPNDTEQNDVEADSGDGKAATEQALKISENPRTSVSSDRSSTPKVIVKDEPEQDVPMPNAPSAPVQQLIEKFGVIKFQPDLALFDKVFGELPESGQGGNHIPDGLSDRIITDSFGTVDERKVWYRISRFGSMRKHNSGDEENYHRVSWQDTQLHGDVTKIVRRWMEEDSFSGKPTLGGSKRTSVFNWNSSAAPIGLDKVFARKSLVPHSRTSSVAAFGHTPASSIGSLGSVLEDRKTSQGIDLNSTTNASASGSASASASPVPSFGWSSTAPPSLMRPPGSVPYLANAEVPTEKSRPSVPPIPSPIPAPRPQQLLPVHSHPSDDDEDGGDEWGEMVLSPTQETFTASEANSDFVNGWSPPSSSPVLSKPHVAPETRNMPANQQLASRSLRAETPPVVSPPLTSHKTPHNSHPAISTASLDLQTDPWASVDLSNFDAPATKVKSPVVTTPKLAVSISESKSPLGMANNLLPTSGVALGPIESSKAEMETDVVHHVLQNLPDLSYMLR
ncbi:hypothetical protein AB5N19_11438 [Seiridium cardinale]|uniref:Uncharacterized protein n=1 Tax=Seiridium cardinale TaxID=138064 RepID=A0ABR2X9G3_9PEZI